MWSQQPSPEKMDYSEESSFEELPSLPSRSERTPSTSGVNRRVSCPPKMQNTPIQQPWGLKRTSSNHSVFGRPSSLIQDGGGGLGEGGGLVNSLENKIGILQLDSPPHSSQSSYGLPGLQTQRSVHDSDTPSLSSCRLADTADTCSTVSWGSSKRSSLSSIFSIGSQVSDVKSELTDSDSDSSTLTCHSTNTVRSSAPSLRQRAVININKMNSKQFSHGLQNGDCLEQMNRGDNNAMKKLKENKSERERNVKKGNCKLCLKCTCYLALILIVCLAIAVGGALFSEKLEHKCEFKPPDLRTLNTELARKVFGQHIALNMVSERLLQFYSPSNLESILVFSFHGWTGVGKNHVAGIVSAYFSEEHIIKLIVPLHFPHENEADLYGMQIQEWIRTNISQCASNIFIIDEMDKANSVLIHGLKNVLLDLKHNKNAFDENAQGKEVMHSNQSKTVIMLLSNSGGAAINRISLDHILQGNSRDKLTRDEFQDILLVKDKSTWYWYQELYSAGLIDALVPFLPLQATHVESCVRSYLQSRNHWINDDEVTEIVESFDYFPANEPLFAKAGCKRVADLVALYVDQ